MITAFLISPYIGLLAGMTQVADGSGMGFGVEGGLSVNIAKARFTARVSYSKLSSETTVDTSAQAFGGGYTPPGQVRAFRSLDAIDFAFGPSLAFGSAEAGFWLGTSLHTSDKLTDEAGYSLEEYPSRWVFLAGGGMGWNWQKFGLWLFVDRHTGEGGVWFFGGKVKLFP